MKPRELRIANCGIAKFSWRRMAWPGNLRFREKSANSHFRKFAISIFRVYNLATAVFPSTQLKLMEHPDEQFAQNFHRLRTADGIRRRNYLRPNRTRL